MVEDTSPENLRKFLNSDDPAMARMGISMAKAIGIEVTFKDLEHFLYRGNIETARNGAMLMEEAGIPVVKIIDELIQNIEKNKDNPMYELIEILPTFGKAALEPLFNLFSSVNYCPPDYEYASWDDPGEKIGEKIGETAMKALAEINEPETVDYLGSMLQIQCGSRVDGVPRQDWTPNWNACCNAADFLLRPNLYDSVEGIMIAEDDFTPNSKIGDVAASVYMYLKDEDKHHHIGCSDLMERLTSLIEANGLDGLDSSSLESGQIHDTLETVFSYCSECCEWIRPKMVLGLYWEEEGEVEGCPICENPVELE